jgi:hypothetical protein
LPDRAENIFSIYTILSSILKPKIILLKAATALAFSQCPWLKPGPEFLKLRSRHVSFEIAASCLAAAVVAAEQQDDDDDQ